MALTGAPPLAGRIIAMAISMWLVCIRGVAAAVHASHKPVVVHLARPAGCSRYRDREEVSVGKEEERRA